MATEAVYCSNGFDAVSAARLFRAICGNLRTFALGDPQLESELHSSTSAVSMQEAIYRLLHRYVFEASQKAPLVIRFPSK